MVAVLIAASLFTRQILWTPIKAINMKNVITNQFTMTNATFFGTDKDGNPFKIRAKTGYQSYDKPDIVFLESPSGTITRLKDNVKTTDKIWANRGTFNHKEKILNLYGNVRVDSSNGDKMLTEELVIKL